MTNSLGIVFQRIFFLAPKYINNYSLYCCQPKKRNADKNMLLEIAINTFCFIIDEDFRLGKNVPNQPLSY